MISAFLFTTWSMKPGSWCEKPLWSCRQTCEREQVVERGDRPPPRDRARHLQPLRVLVEHRVDDVDEGLVAVEQAVPAGQEVALEPALAEVLREDLHHAAVRGQALVRRLDLGVPRAGRRPRRRRRGGSTPSRRARRAGSCRGSAAITSRRKRAEDARRLGELGAGPVDLERVVAEVREHEVAEQQAAVRVRVRAHARARPRARARPARDETALVVEELLRAVAAHPLAPAGAGARRSSRTSVIGTWCERHVPSIGSPSTSFGPVQPFGERRTIIGQRGRSVAPPSRAARWISAIRSSASSSAPAKRRCASACSSSGPIETKSGS